MVHVTLCMVMTVNGKITNNQNTMGWSSKEDWEHFVSLASRIGTILIGKNTYLSVKDAPFFPLPGCLTVVATHDISLTSPHANVIFTDLAPKDILTMLEKRGCTNVLIGGGALFNASCMKENIIHEVYVTLEPLFFGQGLPLFSPQNFEHRLHLLDIAQLNDNTVRLHYTVIQ